MANLIKGNVIKGHGLGKKLGFPTLNIEYGGRFFGIFAADVVINGKWYKSAIHIGKRSILKDNKILLEAHLLDFNEQIPDGTEIGVKLLQKIRITKKFSDIPSLKKQIAKDVEFIKNWYNHGEV